MFIRIRNTLVNLNNIDEISVEELIKNLIHVKISGRGIERSIRVKEENKEKLIDTLLRELSERINSSKCFDLHEFLDEIENKIGEPL